MGQQRCSWGWNRLENNLLLLELSDRSWCLTWKLWSEQFSICICGYRWDNVHSVAQGCRWAGIGAISTQTVLTARRKRRLRHIKHLIWRICYWDRDATLEAREAELNKAPACWSRCTVPELKKSGKRGLQGANSQLWPLHSRENLLLFPHFLHTNTCWHIENKCASKSKHAE